MMAIKVEEVLGALMHAGQGAFADNWGEISGYAEAEFEKVAQQIVEISDNVTLYEKDPTKGYSAAAGKILMNMQRLALANVIIALSSMTLVMAEQAINAMLDVVKSTLGGVLKTIL